MSAKTLSSKVRIKTSSELPPEVLGRYGFFEDHPELEFSRTSARGKRPVRPYSYVEPRVLRQNLISPDDDAAAVEIRDSIGHRGPIQHRSTAASTAWLHAAAEPVGGASGGGYSSAHRRSAYSPGLYLSREPLLGGAGGVRVLSEYTDRDTVRAPPPPTATHRPYGRWSVYGSAPSSWTRSQSTPPARYERSSQVLIHRQPIFGSQLTPRKDREYSIGVKLAESQTELDSFNRLLERTFRGGSGYGVHPPPPPSRYSSDHYDYLGPKTRYEFNVYSPPTKVTRPTERSLVYGYSEDYEPYSSRYYSKYVPPSLYNYTDYRSDGLRYEPWYLPYYSRSGYYSAGSYLSPSVGRYTTAKYLY